MNGAVLVLNAGSSSLKFTLFANAAGPIDDAAVDARLCEGQVSASDGDTPRMQAHDGAGKVLIDSTLPADTHGTGQLGALLAWIDSAFAGVTLRAAAHRVVHGGPRYSEPVLVDDAVLAELRRLVPLAPLHQPHAIAAIEALRASHPALPQVACFDTAFHHTLPLVERSFALPRALADEGVRRYGFHGLSYEYISGRLADVLGPALATGRVVVAHLGAGASLCALRNGVSVATTMGMTPLDGLFMGSRCGRLDPGVVLYLLQEKGMTAHAAAHLLYHDSGMQGVSGISADMRTLQASAAPAAAEAVDLFVYGVTRELGSMAAALGGVDALVFTGGIGEHAAAIRQRICDGAAWLGVDADPAANAAHAPCISRPGSRASAWRIATDEDQMIMRHTRRLLPARD